MLPPSDPIAALNAERPTVLLEWYEIDKAAGVGCRRQIEAMRAGKPDIYGFFGAGWDVHIAGAQGEVALAKWLDVYWGGSVNCYRNIKGDVGDYEVRTRTRKDYELLIRPDDVVDTAFYILAHSFPPNTFKEAPVGGLGVRLMGWMRGRDAKNPKWIAHHGGRAPAYFVPHTELHPMSMLPVPPRRMVPQVSPDTFVVAPGVVRRPAIVIPS